MLKCYYNILTFCVVTKHHTYNILTIFRSPIEHRVFGGGGVEQTWLWKNATENGICFDPRIRKTCPCNVSPLKPHFYIAKLGNKGVYIFFLFLLQNKDAKGRHAADLVSEFHQENMSMPLIFPFYLANSKTGVCRGIPYFLIFDPAKT